MRQFVLRRPFLVDQDILQQDVLSSFHTGRSARDAVGIVDQVSKNVPGETKFVTVRQMQMKVSVFPVTETFVITTYLQERFTPHDSARRIPGQSSGEQFVENKSTQRWHPNLDHSARRHHQSAGLALETFFALAFFARPFPSFSSALRTCLNSCSDALSARGKCRSSVSSALTIAEPITTRANHL